MHDVGLLGVREPGGARLCLKEENKVLPGPCAGEAGGRAGADGETGPDSRDRAGGSAGGRLMAVTSVTSFLGPCALWGSQGPHRCQNMVSQGVPAQCCPGEEPGVCVLPGLGQMSTAESAPKWDHLQGP